MPTNTHFLVDPPALSDEITICFPEDHVLVVRMNRPRSLNAMTPQMASDIKAVFDWFDDEPSLWVVVITGEGRAFCAGADLKASVRPTRLPPPSLPSRTDISAKYQYINTSRININVPIGNRWNVTQQGGHSHEQEDIASSVHGFGSLSRRASSKPIVAAVNGGAFGGGVEILLNCDIVIASDDAVFALPEVKRGVIAAQGGTSAMHPHPITAFNSLKPAPFNFPSLPVIPRLKAVAGHQLAAEMLLLGRPVGAAEAQQRFRLYARSPVPSPSKHSRQRDNSNSNLRPIHSSYFFSKFVSTLQNKKTPSLSAYATHVFPMPQTQIQIRSNQMGTPSPVADMEPQMPKSVNAVVPKDEVLPTAVEWATRIAANSPDAVQCTKRGLVLAARHGDVERAVIEHAWSAESRRVYGGDNIKEGLRAFSEVRTPFFFVSLTSGISLDDSRGLRDWVGKRKPNWRNPAKL
ncbi:hypothetical protein EW146_g8564 [Bondarzewia mesenterica]|uniref:Uncharacterized protein n=1 Tax=Bondarzewia mesenterica TaxID=1095465 RepID=A0A4S4LF41_9AGAM|nr:hypothetical protein EW146_g8564 [Bondarzewia mesenterica]